MRVKNNHPLIGKRFNRLVVLKRVGTTKHANAILQCLCDCGKVVVRNCADIKRGDTKSCGCLKVERLKTHGKTEWHEYKTWARMKFRCSQFNEKDRKNYSDRGITVCNRWNKFENFINDMGRMPSSNHSIDRIDNDGNYEPSNCRWVTHTDQSNNKRTNVWVECMGMRRTAAQWSKLTGISKNVIAYRIRSGWDDYDAINVEPHHRNRHQSHWVEVLRAKESD